MVTTYKIELFKSTYLDIFEPFLIKSQLKMPMIDKGDKIDIYIKRKCVLNFLQSKIFRDIGDIEEIRSAFDHRIEIIK